MEDGKQIEKENHTMQTGSQQYRNDIPMNPVQSGQGETLGGPRGVHGTIADNLARMREVNKILQAIKARLVGQSPSPIEPPNAKDPHEPSTMSLHEKLNSAIGESEELVQQLANIVG